MVSKSRLVDICAGPMTPKQAARELENYAYRNPSTMVITMSKREDGRYQTAVYIDLKAFKNPFPKDL